jgi:glycosyltransferase involved in cell wall biosynthesis
MLTMVDKLKAGSTYLSIIIPAYNEEQSIGPVLDELQNLMSHTNMKYEIIVVDDGSTDATAEKVKTREDVRLVRHPANCGYGGAIKTGIRHASGECILITDADGTYPVSEIPKLLEPAAEYDMIVGARTGDDVKDVLYRRALKWFLKKLASYLSRRKIPDLNSGLRVFKKSDVINYLHLLPSGFSFTTTITLTYHCNDYMVKYVPIDYCGRVKTSKIKPFKDGMNFILLILKVITYFNPLRIFLPLSFGLLLASVIVFLGSLFLLDRILDATIISLFVAAIQTGSFGLLADAFSRRQRQA